MIILAMESAGSTAGVALMKDGGLLGEYGMRQMRTHSETMMPMTEMLMRELHIAPADLGVIAVNAGPGSFTGIRIGVCAANAMGMALGIPVIGVLSLESLYENVRVFPGLVCTMIDAGNERAYAALFENGRMVQGAQAVEAETYIQTLPPNTLFVGDGAAAYKELIVSVVENAVMAPDIQNAFYAGSLCCIANTLLKGGNAITMQAKPFYLTLSQAERMWENKQKEGNP